MATFKSLVRLLLWHYAAAETEPARPSRTWRGWQHHYQAGRDDVGLEGGNGTEVLHLTVHEGKLFAGVSYEGYPSFKPLEILSLANPDDRWKLAGRPSALAVRPEVLKSVTWTTDDTGAALPTPVNRLVAGYHYRNGEAGECRFAVMRPVRTFQMWGEGLYFTEKPWRENYFSAGAMTMHTDAVTGVQHMFFSAGVPGIVKGAYDAYNEELSVKFESSPETEKLPSRPQSLVVVGGKLYAAGGSYITKRTDGVTATWAKVFDMADFSPGTVDESVGGIRGLTAILHPSGVGESLYFAWCPNRHSQGCMIRVDVDGEKYTHTQEACVTQEAAKVISDGQPVDPKSFVFAAASYNFALPVPADSGGSVHLVGYEIQLWGPTDSKFPTNEEQRHPGDGGMYGFYAGAGYLIRRSPSSYEARDVGGPRFCSNEVTPALTAARTYALSPFDKDGVYFGGYDSNHFESKNTAWIFNGDMAAVHAKPVDYGDRRCTTTTRTSTTFTTRTTTTSTTTLACPFCQSQNSVPHWLMLREEHATAVGDGEGVPEPVNVSFVMDGNRRTWGGAKRITLDLQSTFAIRELKVDFQQCRHCMRPGSLLLQAAANNVFTTFLKPVVPIIGSHSVESWEVNVTGRYLRFWAPEDLHSDGFVGIWEIEIFGYRVHASEVLNASAPAGIDDSGRPYDCQAAQNWVNSGRMAMSCNQARQLWQEKCCVEASSTTTTSSSNHRPVKNVASQPVLMPDIDSGVQPMALTAAAAVSDEELSGARGFVVALAASLVFGGLVGLACLVRCYRRSVESEGARGLIDAVM